MTDVLLLVVITALLFDFVNGWNDSANAIATVVSTRVLAPLTAVTFAAVLNFGGALISTKVAKTIGGGLVDPEVVGGAVVLAAMVAGAVWVAICTFAGLPISGSHSLIGGLVGAAVAVHGVTVVKLAGIIKVLVALIVSPVLGLIGGYILLKVVFRIAESMHPKAVRRSFSIAQIVSSGFVAVTHGTNDAQKVMGVITLALYSAGNIPDLRVPLWVMMACAIVMGLGTAAGGWRVIKTLGTKLAHIRPIEGFAAETAAGFVLVGAAGMGVPVSTTHTITGSILGVGSARHLRSVKWDVGKKILYAWVLTLPATVILGGLIGIAIGPL